MGTQPWAISCKAEVVSVSGRRIVVLPVDASAALPSRGQVAVSGTIDGRDFRTVVEPDGARGHWIQVDERIPDGRGLEPGEIVELELTPMKEWPEPDVPEDLQLALDEASDVADLWESITPMARWEWVRWVRATRNPATRARRVDVTTSKLRSGRRRPCCFDLSACTDPELSRGGRLMEPDR